MLRTVDSTNYANESSRWTVLFIICSCLYLLHACYAVAVERHLYGDASWFLVRMISEGKPTDFYTNFWQQFYFSRVVAYWITQLPTIIAVKSGVASVSTLAHIFGATYFGHRFISLVICYLLLGRDQKKLIIFPLLGLFAGTIVSDVYIVTEIHIATSFLWPIATLLFRREVLVGTAYWIVVITILLASFTYESWAIFSPILLIGLVFKALVLKIDAPEQGLRLPLWPSFALIVCGAINWCAILFPRDPANKAGFLNGIIKIINDAAVGPSYWDISAIVAILAAGSVLLLLILSVRLKPALLQWIALAMAVAFALAPPLHFYTTEHSLDLARAITDRGFAGLVMQGGLLAMFIIVCLCRYDFRSGFRCVSWVILGLSIGQVAWQMMATHLWSDAVHATYATVDKYSGPVACEAVDAHRSGSPQAPAPSKIMCSWWVTPFSLLRDDQRQIRTILVVQSAFQAFDAYEPGSLPGLANKAFKYDTYLAALQDKGRRSKGTDRIIMFGVGDSGVNLLRSGFSHPESAQTWTVGRQAVVHICLPTELGPGTYRMIFTVIPHLDPRNSPMLVEVRSGTGKPVEWQFQKSTGPWAERSVDINRGDFGGERCGDISLHFDNVPPSPAELGESKDDRHLGLALIKAQINAM